MAGELPALLTGMPPHIMLHFFLYQLRSCYNAGFKTAFVISGHAGGNQQDYRLVAGIFEKYSGMKILVYADPELVEGSMEGDHASKYEISQMLYLRPETINLAAINRMHEPDSLGRFAQGEDAAEASAELGEEIIEESLALLGDVISAISHNAMRDFKMMNYDEVETM